MTQARLRQVTRLEKLVRPYLERKQEAHSYTIQFMRNQAFIKLANLALLILHGDPKIDKSLSAAWQRCRESAAWKTCRERHPDFGSYGRDDNSSPFVRFSARDIAYYFRQYFFPDLPGADEIAKLDLIFKSAPPWLLWLTCGDVYARLLGIKTPDLSSFHRFERGCSLWADLPTGPFEYRPLPAGVRDPFTFSANKNIEIETKDMTPRERKRTLRIFEHNK